MIKRIFKINIQTVNNLRIEHSKRVWPNLYNVQIIECWYIQK